MKFGVREICDVVFKALQTTKIGDLTFLKGQPVLYIDTAKTSVIEGAATTTYATGGRGNARLIAWEGEKTLTFTVEDALLSPIGFAVLSGAGLFDLSKEKNKTAMVHCTAVGQVDTQGKLEVDEPISERAPIFVSSLEKGSLGEKLTATLAVVSSETGKRSVIVTYPKEEGEEEARKYEGQVFVDYYTERSTGVTEIQIDAGNFAGFYYVEASTLFRREEDGFDMPAEIVFPRVKIQSNFTFNMAATGDPSTFTFTMDAFPAYTMFDKKKKVLCAIQVVADDKQNVYDSPVTRLATGYKVDAEIMNADSIERLKAYKVFVYNYDNESISFSGAIADAKAGDHYNVYADNKGVDSRGTWSVNDATILAGLTLVDGYELTEDTFVKDQTIYLEKVS